MYHYENSKASAKNSNATASALSDLKPLSQQKLSSSVASGLKMFLGSKASDLETSAGAAKKTPLGGDGTGIQVTLDVDPKGTAGWRVFDDEAMLK